MQWEKDHGMGNEDTHGARMGLLAGLSLLRWTLEHLSTSVAAGKHVVAHKSTAHKKM